MWFLSLLWNTFFTNMFTAIISLLIGLVVYKLSKLYLQVYTLPPGPLPLPIIGNILLFKSSKHFVDVINKQKEKYGPVFTLWMGYNPFVFISDIDLAREAFRKNELAGRQDSFFASMLSNEKHKDVVFTDYGHTWESLRRVTHSAAQKYSTNEKLIYLAADCVDLTVKSMIEKEGIDKGFNPKNYLFLLFLNILATSATGTRYSIEDKEFKKMLYIFRDFPHEIGARLALWEVSTLVQLWDRKLVNKQKELIVWSTNNVKNKFIAHYKDYSESIERDFCDALITAKNEALRIGKESAPYLTDENLAMAVHDLIIAGTDTSQQTFLWIVFFFCYYPEFQKKLRQEVETQIGDKIATHEDKNRCHYIMAFIMETLRFRNVVPNGLPHKAVVDCKIGDYTIPEGMGVFVNQGMILTDEKYWTNGNEFRPERFLENGKLVNTRPKAYIPFSVGRRVCLGEKLALTDLFLVLVRFLQSTSDYSLVLGKNKGIEPDANVALGLPPQEFEIIFKSK